MKNVDRHPMNTQQRSDQRFLYLAGWGNWGETDDIPRIRKVLRVRMFVELSASEAFTFWSWRSAQYDASWLTIKDDDDMAMILMLLEMDD